MAATLQDLGLDRLSVEDRVALAQQLLASAAKEEPFPLHGDRSALRIDEGGTVRVGDSRVRLDVVVEQYDNGMTAEDLVRAYETLELADVHAAIAYYLRHRDEVRAYLKRRAEEAEALRAKIEAERPPLTREQLLARRSPMKE
jgi:uncharacterized protein (DUF433 family)